MNVAITGASGFLGRHLVVELRRSGHDITAIVRPTSDTSSLASARIAVADLNDLDAMQRAFQACEVVYHLAGAVDFGADWERFHNLNVIGTANVLQAARRAGVRRVVHCSSIVAVGASCRPLRLDETADWNLEYLNVPYVTTKWQAEQLALKANGENLEVVVANPSAVIGPGDGQSEFGTLCHRFWHGRIPIHFGGGQNYVDVRDVAIGLRLCGDRGQPGQRYILGGENRSMTAFFSELARVARRTYPRMRLPGALAPAASMIALRMVQKRHRPAYLSAAQAKLISFFFFVDSTKARRELGFASRPIHDSLNAAYSEFELTHV